MKILTIEEVVENVPKNWKRQYHNGKDGIYERLIEAKPLTKEKIDSIIGNESWTRLVCDECEKEANTLVFFGRSSSGICKKCLGDAMTLILKDAKH